MTQAKIIWAESLKKFENFLLKVIESFLSGLQRLDKGTKNLRIFSCLEPVLRIRIRFLRILMFFVPPGSGFGYHQAKIVRKILIPTVLWLLYDFYL